jgi:hypothetical protein
VCGGSLSMGECPTPGSTSTVAFRTARYSSADADRHLRSSLPKITSSGLRERCHQVGTPRRPDSGGTSTPSGIKASGRGPVRRGRVGFAGSAAGQDPSRHPDRPSRARPISQARGRRLRDPGAGVVARRGRWRPSRPSNGRPRWRASRRACPVRADQASRRSLPSAATRAAPSLPAARRAVTR